MSEPASLGVSEKEWQFILQSKQTFNAASEESSNERMARAANGEVVSDTESDVRGLLSNR